MHQQVPFDVEIDGIFKHFDDVGEYGGMTGKDPGYFLAKEFSPLGELPVFPFFRCRSTSFRERNKKVVKCRFNGAPDCNNMTYCREKLGGQLIKQ